MEVAVSVSNIETRVDHELGKSSFSTHGKTSMEEDYIGTRYSLSLILCECHHTL